MATVDNGVPHEKARVGRRFAFGRWKGSTVLQGQFGHSDMDSIPQFVMRTGVISPFNPINARQDISERHVQGVTNAPVAMQPGVAPINGFGYSGFGEAGAVVGTIDKKHWILGAGVGAVVGILGGIFGAPDSRTRGAIVGGVAGVGAAAVALYALRRRGYASIPSADYQRDKDGQIITSRAAIS
jgi:hypothetical protein